METINNVATAATKVIWGENSQPVGEEPISGKQGDTSKGEPFDAGNIESSEQKGVSEDAAHAKTTGTAAEAEGTPQNASTERKARDMPADTSAGQNDVRDPENPQTNPKSAPTDVDDSGDGPNEAQKLDGPGPKPIEEVAREKGGDAGKAAREEAGSAGESGGSDNKDGEEPDELHQPSQGEGTGEQYVKSSGLQADGGDFDVTKPGAGREADRLLEEKGVKRDDGSNGAADNTNTNTNGNGATKEKRSLGDKIKSAFHKK